MLEKTFVVKSPILNDDYLLYHPGHLLKPKPEKKIAND